MKVVYWSDYACPYCYIGVTRLKKAIGNLKADGTLGVGEKVELEILAFELDEGAPTKPFETTVERFARKYGLSAEEAARRVDHISQLGRDEGIDFRYATTMGSNTFDAHRLTKYAKDTDPGIASALEERLYAAYFVDNLVLADRDVLAKVAAECGLDGQGVRDVLEGDAYAAQVREDEKTARGIGVGAVPFFVLDGRLAVPGAVSISDFESAIREALGKDGLPTMPQDGNDSSEACGPDGCEWRPK